MFAIEAVLIWLASSMHSTILWNLLALLAAIVWFRLLAAVVVRTSITVGADQCLELDELFFTIFVALLSALLLSKASYKGLFACNVIV